MLSLSIVGFSFNDNIKPTLAALKDRLEMSDSELKKMVVAMPAIIGYSNIITKLDWLQKTFDLNQLQLLQLVTKNKMLMGVSLQSTLVPGVAFWRECFEDRTDAEAMAEIISKPSELTQSNKRLRKRSALFIEHGIPLKLLWGKKTYTDDKLNSWLDRNCDKFCKNAEFMTT